MFSMASLVHDAFVDPAAAEQATVNCRMQGLDPAVHDLGEARLVGDLSGLDASFAQLFCGAARGQYFSAEFGQAFDKGDQVALVRDTDERASDFEHLSNQRVGA
jgi:hypothetical protein